MKQHITEEQYNELSENQKKTWEKSMRNKGYTMEKVYGPPGQYWPFIPDSILNFPSIGEMIEFLDREDAMLDISREINKKPFASVWHIDLIEKKNLKSLAVKPELCDALWEAVKEILEK